MPHKKTLIVPVTILNNDALIDQITVPQST